MKTPEEAYKRPVVSHFRIFRSLVYCHVAKDALKKLEPKIEFGMFVGYTNTPHNYRVYMLTSRMIVLHKDISFDKEKAMQVSLERELELHADEVILASKDEGPRIDVEHPHVEFHRVETSTHEESLRERIKCTREADRLLDDAQENVGAPSSHRRERRSLERYTRYMALMGACVVTETSSFQEVVQPLVWVDAMAEDYDSIV